MAAESKAVVSHLYPRKDMSSFDIEYYLKRHIPTEKFWIPLGMTECLVCDVEADSEFAIETITFWKDLDSWNTAKNGDAARKLVADIPNITNVKPVVVVGNLLHG